MEIAVATRTHPDQWRDTPPQMVATVLEVLAEQARKAQRRR